MTDSHDTATNAIPQAGAGPRMLHVPINSIARSLTNPRKTFDQVKLLELADSIAASGVHQPILLRPLPPHRLADTLQTARAQKLPAPEYELVAGERRWRACHLAKVAEIPAMIRPMTDAQALEAQVIENLQREDVTELEEAEGYQILMETLGINADEVGQRIGKSRSYVYGRLKILDLCEPGRQALREGKLDFSCGLYIARIPNEQLQLKALAQATDHNKGWNGDRMSAREVQRMVQTEYMTKLEYAKFDRDDASLCPAAGSCTACPHRTGANPDLFADVGSADVCTNPPCYRSKEDAHTARQRERAVAMGAEIITGREAKALMPNAIGSAVEGYLRLDVASDSPIKGKLLRTVIGEVMEQTGIKPTLIENPHDKGELVAVIRHDQAAELLKMAGKGTAEAKLREEAKTEAEAKARQDEVEAANQYERAWRGAVVRAIAKDVRAANLSQSIIEAAELAVATHVLRMVNKEEASRLAELLQLGKVAPHDGLRDTAQSHTAPVTVAMLVLLMRDASYTPWVWEHDPGAERNPMMHAMAKLFSIDVEAVKTQMQADIRATKAAASPDKTEAPKADIPLTPASRNNKGAGHGKANKRKGPAALAGGVGGMLSADAATASIAAALLALPGEPDQGAAAAAQGDEAGPVAAEAAQALPPSAEFRTDNTVAPLVTTPASKLQAQSAGDGNVRADAKTGAPVNQAAGASILAAADFMTHQVRVLPNATGKWQKNWIGDVGKVVAVVGDTAINVEFPAAPRCKPVRVAFDVTELEVVE